MRSLMSAVAVAVLGLSIAAIPAMAKDHPAKHNQATTQPTTKPADPKHKQGDAKPNKEHNKHHNGTTQPAGHDKQ